MSPIEVTPASDLAEPLSLLEASLRDGEPVPEAFAALGVRPSILRALAELKFVTPSEIQALLIPRAMAGVDILGQARTGTGKTLGFGVPLLQRIVPPAERPAASSPA